MAKFKFEFDGLDQYLNMLSEVEDSNRFIKRAVYDGASVVGLAILADVNALPVNNGKFVPGELPITGISQEQKQGLIEGFGYTKMETKNGVTYTKVGFGGYNNVKTKKYPNGQPNPMIANAINSGTSRRPKTQFVDKAVNKSKSQCIEAMVNRFDADLQQLVKEYE